MRKISAFLSLSLVACWSPNQASSSNGSDDPSGQDDQTESDDANDTSDDEGPQVVCMPGEARCTNEGELETCAPTGLMWNIEPCGAHQHCVPCQADERECSGAVCRGPCEASDEPPSSAGCSFFATGLLHHGLVKWALDDYGAAMVIGNPNVEGSALVQLYFVPRGSNIEEPVGEAVELPPGESHVFRFDPEVTDLSGDSNVQNWKHGSGGIYHAVSDLPVIAYLHTPYEHTVENESTLLLPERALRREHVIYGQRSTVRASYFVVIAIEDQTTVRWWPRVETAGDNFPLPFVEANGTGEQLLNRFDTIRVPTSNKYDRPDCERDLSGTLVSADKPIWVLSAAPTIIPYCIIPPAMPSNELCVEPLGPYEVDQACYAGSNLIFEQNIPIDYWGKSYVGPASPERASEPHYWRIYAGDDDITINVTPTQPNTPIHLDKRGDWVELEVAHGTHVLFEGTGPFMPVQYTASHFMAENIGDPAMVQMIPVEQYLSRYAFITGFDYPYHYVQVIRKVGNAEILLDGQVVEGYQVIANYEISTMAISEGAHVAVSDDAFGLVQYGYFEGALQYPAAYAYPGGMKVEQLHIP